MDMGKVLEGIDYGDTTEEIDSKCSHRKRLVDSITDFAACLGEWRTFLTLHIKSSAQEVDLPYWSIVLVSLL